MNRKAKAKPRRSEPARQGPATGQQKTGSRDSVAAVILLAAFAALVAAGQFVTCDSVAIVQGNGVTLSMLWMLLLLAWSFAVWRRAITPLAIDRTTWAVAAFLALLVLATLVRIGDINARAALNALWHWITLGTIFFLGRQLLRTSAQCKAVMIVMGSIAVSMSLHGYYDSLYRMPRFRARYFNMDEGERAEVHREMGVHAPSGSPEAYLVRNRIQSLEPTASFALTNSLAGFLAPWLIVWLGIAWFSFQRWRDKQVKESERPQWTAWLLPLALAILLGGCLLTTKSRSATLGVAVASFVLVANIGKSNRALAWKLGLSGLALAAIVLRVIWYVGRLDGGFLGEALKSFSYRVEYWQASCRMIADYFWTGCGLGNYQDFYSAYKLPEASETIADPHNLLLEVLCNAGLLGLTGLVALFGCFLAQRRLASRTPQSAQKTPIRRFGAKAIYLGAIIGILMAIPVSLMTNLPVESALVFLGIGSTIVCTWWFHQWVGESAGQVRSLASLGLLALVVNLLASGGSSSYGVGQGVWLLMAMSLWTRQDRNARVPSSAGRSSLLLVAAAVVSIANLLTAYMPVVLASGRLVNGSLMISPRGSLTEFQAAARSDPFSPAPWEQMARLHHRMWLRDQSVKNWSQFRDAVEQLARRDPHSHRTSDQIGGWYLSAFVATKNKPMLVEATKAFDRSTELNPNSNLANARSAWLHNLLQDTPQAAKFAHRALELDARNPHIERGLQRQLLFGSIPGRSARSFADMGGELLVEEMRKLAKPQ